MPSISESVDPVHGESVQANTSNLLTARHILALSGGAVAGALRLESLYGFGFYLLIAAVTSMMLFVLLGSPSLFFEKPIKAVLLDGFLSAFPGYVLAWSLVYSIVET